MVHGGLPRKNRLAIKNIPAATYLNVDKSQLYIIEQFGEGKTCGDVLMKLILDSRAPALREFYELVLKAYRNNILIDASSPPPAKTPPWNFFLKVPPWAVVLLGVLSAGTIGYAQFAHPFELPGAWWQILPGFLIASLALSFGQVLAAGCLRFFQAEVYQAQFHWKTLIPHLRWNLMDARMVDPRCETYVGLLRFLPIILALGLTMIFLPAAATALLIPLIGYSFPYRQSPVDQIFKGLTQRVPLDIHRDYLFHPRPSTMAGWFRTIRHEGKRYLGLKFIYLIAWLALGSVLSFFAFGYYTSGTFETANLTRALRWIPYTLGGALVLFLVYQLLRDAIPATRKFFQEKKTKQTESRRLMTFTKENPPSEEEMVQILRESFIFGELPPEDCLTLVQSMQVRFCAKGEVIVSEKNEQHDLFVTFSGRLQVQKELSDGKILNLAVLSRGDVFGKIPLWNEVPRRRTIKALTPAIVYSLPESEFASVVLSTESHMAIRDAVKASFLSRIKIFQKWTPSMVRALARMGTFTSTPQDQNIISEGQPNQFFYIIYDGVVEIIRKGKSVKTLRIGDFFGELSVLRNTLAISDVYCKETGRSLVFSKKDFLRFLTSYPQAALTFEEIASSRLGYPVFPVKRV